mmetsp:Transcript_9366/g.23320  ORF Transcript_9366/g.23320 Transcript_9366/m.23320 type:complete len:99 (-) Transcript_9366:22-318(-)
MERTPIIPCWNYSPVVPFVGTLGLALHLCFHSSLWTGESRKEKSTIEKRDDNPDGNSKRKPRPARERSKYNQISVALIREMNAQQDDVSLDNFLTRKR